MDTPHFRNENPARARHISSVRPLSRRLARLIGCGLAVAVCLGAGPVLSADDTSDSKKQLGELQRQNELLQQQLRKQQELIDTLSRKVAVIEKNEEKRDSTATANKEEAPAVPTGLNRFGLGKVNVTGEGSVAFFHSGSEGQFPNSEFRVDEAKLFVEAPLWENVYFSGELNLMTREEPNLNLRIGELYVDFEDVSRLWDRERQLNLRFGRFDVPFGEEYLVRDAIDNPLISHSISDLWGVDEGVELYGALGKFQYVFAVQNGGHSVTRDFNGDKALTGRLGYDPKPWLHLSLSAMRTGALDVQQDRLSELWLGPGFVRSLGSTNTTTFQADVIEGDVQVRLPHGHLKFAGGTIHYDDDDPNANNQRDVYYYYVEGLHNFTPKWFAVARWSQMFANKGFPIVGNGDFALFFRGPLTEDLWRLSLGAGHRFNRNLVIKGEYSFEGGRMTNGNQRDKEDQIALVVVFAF